MKIFSSPLRQRGISLIELMVGLSIGLLVVAVAMGALMVSRGVTGTVSDVSNIQQQGAYILRVIGGQLRQAGSLYLNPDATGSSGTDPLGAVAFETDAIPTDSAILAFKQDDTIKYDSNTGEMSVMFRRYRDPVFTSSTPITLVLNCLSGPSDDNSKTSSHEAVQSIFSFKSDKNELHCGGNGATAQPVVQNMAQFQVNYLEQVVDGAGTTVKYVAAADVSNWRSVQGVQVCLVLYGNEAIDLPTGTDAATVKSRSYTDCAGTSVDMASLTGARKNRMHIVFRNVFQLRSQGLL
jgi:type IV pilus assembly protein PilW